MKGIWLWCGLIGIAVHGMTFDDRWKMLDHELEALESKINLESNRAYGQVHTGTPEELEHVKRLIKEAEYLGYAQARYRLESIWRKMAPLEQSMPTTLAGSPAIQDRPVA